MCSLMNIHVNANDFHLDQWGMRDWKEEGLSPVIEDERPQNHPEFPEGSLPYMTIGTDLKAYSKLTPKCHFPHDNSCSFLLSSAIIHSQKAKTGGI